jgi:hypothetical protein
VLSDAALFDEGFRRPCNNWSWSRDKLRGERVLHATSLLAYDATFLDPELLFISPLLRSRPASRYQAM